METSAKNGAGIRAVFFDVGGTIINETRQWEGWARWLDVGNEVFFAALGAVIDGRKPIQTVFHYFGRADLDPLAARMERIAAGEPDEFEAQDVYPDVYPCIQALVERGVRVGIAGNQPAHRQEPLRHLGLNVSVLATSASWNVEKPAPEFFDRVIEEAGVEPEEIVYVGDRVDHDVVPAVERGLHAVLVRRGPWGVIQATWSEASRAAAIISSLDDLDAVLGANGPVSP